MTTSKSVAVRAGKGTAATPSSLTQRNAPAAVLHMLGCALLVLGLAFGLGLGRGAACAQAATFADAQASLSLSVSCQLDGKAQEGVSFALYRVADVSEDLAFSPAGDFARYAVSLSGLDSAGYKAAAETLAGYAARDALKPLAQGVTDAQGALTFSSAESGLTAGLYLLVGSPTASGGHLWAWEPTLVCLPHPDGQGAWAQTASVTPKSSDEGAVTQVEAHKVWAGEDSASRPSSVTVQLLCDGAAVDEAQLSADNDWRHTWSNLAPGHTWAVVEKSVPDGYATTVERDGDAFVITNTPAASAPTPSTPGGEKLPQTGQLWWPVPVLLALGLLCLAIGVFRRTSGSDGNDK